MPSSSLRFWSTIIFSLVLLAGCDSRPQFKSTDITGADYGKSLELTDHTGRPRKLEDWRGKVVVVFFGFAAMVPIPNCPPAIEYLWPGIHPLPAGPACDASWHIPLRLELAATGIIIALLIAFIGARIDQLVVRSRRVRAARLLLQP